MNNINDDDSITTCPDFSRRNYKKKNKVVFIPQDIERRKPKFDQ